MPKEGSKSGKSVKTSKTARVLSLLTDPPVVEEDETTAEEPKKAADSETEAQIRGALEAELAAGTPPPPREAPAPGPAARPATEAMPAEEAAAPVEPSVPAPRSEAAPFTLEEFAVPEDAVVLSAPERAPAEEAAAAPAEPSAPAPQPVPAPVRAVEPAPIVPPPPPSEPENPEDEHYICLNVTQALVEEKADKYIRMFGMCDCARCRIDVIAMAMSNLPAKYVVVKDKDINPRLSMYESKYNAAVVTQVMSACKKVMERPHHVR